MANGNYRDRAVEYFNAATGGSHKSYPEAAAEFYATQTHGGGAADVAASEVTVDPGTDGLTQADVQAALQDLATRVAALEAV